jgi:hypothetical protein
VSSKAAWWIVAAVGGTLVLLALVAGAGSRTASLRNLVLATLSERLASDVELSWFSVDTFPTVVVRGGGLVIRHRGRRDVPPLVSVKSFTVHGGLLGLFGRPRRFRNVTLDGLVINIPPGGLGSGDSDNPDTSDRAAPRTKSPIVVERLHSRDAQLRIIPRKEGKEPRLFAIHTLEMERLGLGQRMPFKAELTNPVPKGAIHTTGTFGPWQAADPGGTPVDGSYTFKNADLGTIKGIGGTLDSTGAFSGQLNRIAVTGETRTPDFHVDLSGRPVPLHTTFDAIVDGTDGDTYLNDVAATIQNTSLSAKGGVTGTPGVKGRAIKLHVRITDGQLEDLLALSVKSEKPVMVGRVSLHTDFTLPPGSDAVIDRLRLAGEFDLDAARFTDREVQAKITGMSQRAKGTPDQPGRDNVVSDVSGRFRLHQGVLTMFNLAFAIPGAVVKLDGDYGLRSEALSFDGTLRMQATISEAAGGGMKSVFLKLVDPLFRKQHAGAVIPIKVRGTRSEPKFGLDVVRVITPK